MFDTLNTSIIGFPNRSPPTMNSFMPGNFIQAQKIMVPGGVEFHFVPLSIPGQFGQRPLSQQV